jgi:SAM-dependent methyltransferase
MQARDEFKPIPVRPPSDAPLAFALRCLVDLQLGSIVKHLRPRLAAVQGRLLDVGAGESPWRSWLPTSVAYQGLDIGNAAEFGMAPGRDIVYYEGRVMPFADSTFDCALCIEVLEHAEDPQLLVAEMARVLRPGGELLLSVPWSARLHHLPHDFHRFSAFRLKALLESCGFASVDIAERGTDVAAIANKLIVLTIRLLSPGVGLLWRLPVALATGLTAAAFTGAAHLCEAFGLGSKLDPLGYFVRAQKPA